MAEPKKIIVVAGEASGDLHAAGLVKALRDILPDAEFSGLGGAKMRSAGVELFYDLTELSVVGFSEILKHFKLFREIFKNLLIKIDQIKPDAAILVDYPGFNLRLAKQLKKRNIKVIYYISPQIWAWGLNRVHLIKEVVTKMLVILPFEEALYKKYGVDATFVGHPLLDVAKPTVDKERFLKSVGLALNKPTVSLLPGSRRREVEKLLPIMLKSCAIIQRQNPEIQFLLLKASTIDENIFQNILAQTNLSLAQVKESTYDGLQASDAALVASGTATLETAILGVPMVIIYKVSFFTWFSIRQMIKIPYIGLVNVIAGRKIIPECLQYEARPEIIAENIAKILKPQESQTIKNELSKLKESLGTSGAGRRAAEIVAGLIQ